MDNSNKSVSVQTKNAVPQKKALHFLKLASFWVLSINKKDCPADYAVYKFL